ncbi:MAG: hypothetical protein B6D78_14635 [gamma proteobacterium symbiont of Ctena orbiculata]|nr:MAG: hypothetical protein B6D78_14635 [gamma proteobacterium symbiont of Ctena orbiculata]PVV26046.1 MAG: hypothetical protein B6D79_07500 [gamma proteobacterium symbiont of Ctena orbiculata]
MKKIAVGLVGITSMALSGQSSAHVGEHGAMGFVSGVEHLLAEHGYLLALLGVIAVGLILKRTARS